VPVFDHSGKVRRKVTMKSERMRWGRGVVGGGAAILALSVAGDVLAQVSRRDVPVVLQPQQRFERGQDIQPIFEGWVRNDDGGYRFLFGYLNRNYAERPHVPVGENNFFSPGEQDRGQPTHFLPRTHRYQFEVDVPADFPLDGQLVWSVTQQGSTQTAIGWLQPEWEIDVSTITSNGRTGFGRSVDEMFRNESPRMEIEASATTVGVGQPVTLTARLQDDELPSELPERSGSPLRQYPALTPPEDAPEIPDNIRQYQRPSPPRNHLAVLWVVFRGLDSGAIAPDDYQEWEDGMPGDGWTSGTFEATVTFDEPGSYRLRAFGSDAMLISTADLDITVTE